VAKRGRAKADGRSMSSFLPCIEKKKKGEKKIERKKNAPLPFAESGGHVGRGVAEPVRKWG